MIELKKIGEDMTITTTIPDDDITWVEAIAHYLKFLRGIGYIIEGEHLDMTLREIENQ